MEKQLISFQLLLDTCKLFSCFDMVLYFAGNYGLMALVCLLYLLSVSTFLKKFIPFQSFESQKLRNVFLNPESF